jgi:capsular polysaccharide biosynthesis protein
VDLWDLTKLLFRRWLISVPILLLSVVVLIVASQTVKPDYRATGHVIIVAPAQTAKDLADASPNKVHNPWEDLGFRPLAQTAMLKVQSNDVLQQMADAGLSTNVTLLLDDRSPLISIEAVAHSPSVATATIREIIKNLDLAVAQAQTDYGVDHDSLFTARPIDSGDSVETVTSTQKRIMAVIGGIGLVATVAVTILLDAVLRRRASRRTALKAAAGMSEAGEPPVVPAQRGPGGIVDPRGIKGNRKVESDEALTVTLNALGSRRIPTVDSPGADGGNGGNGNGRVLTVDYKRDDGESVDEAKDAAGKNRQPSETASDATVVLPLTSLWGGQDSKRRRR